MMKVAKEIFNKSAWKQEVGKKFKENTELMFQRLAVCPQLLDLSRLLNKESRRLPCLSLKLILLREKFTFYSILHLIQTAIPS